MTNTYQEPVSNLPEDLPEALNNPGHRPLDQVFIECSQHGVIEFLKRGHEDHKEKYFSII